MSTWRNRSRRNNSNKSTKKRMPWIFVTAGFRKKLMLYNIIVVLVAIVLTVRYSNTHPSSDASDYPDIKERSRPKGYLPLQGKLNQEIASALIYEQQPLPEYNASTIDVHKFWAMFGEKPWYRRNSDEPHHACFDEPGFWDNLKNNHHCDRNWYQGGFGSHHDPRNFPEYRPVFGKDKVVVPVVLGHKSEVFKYNCQQVESQRGISLNKCKDFGFVDLSMHAGTSVLQYHSDFGWNMCRNLEWVVCAAHGLVPGQNSPTVRFATLPSVDIEKFLFRRKRCQLGDCESSYSKNDVFVVEVAILSRLCKNREGMFQLQVGQDFKCDIDGHAISHLARAAAHSPGGRARPEMWNKPWKRETMNKKSETQDKNFKTSNGVNISETAIEQSQLPIDEDLLQGLHESGLPLRGKLNAEKASLIIESFNTSSTSFLLDKHKFWAMFDHKGWQRRAGKDACFRESGFWDRLLTNEQCDRNWYEGGFPEGDPRNFKEFRPVYAGHKPAIALLGKDDVDMFSYTCSQMERKKGESSHKCSVYSFIESAFQTGMTILRLDHMVGWNMCRNLEWVVCAIRGMLSEQRGVKKIRFATNPAVALEDFWFRRVDCWYECETSYSWEDVYLGEVSMISYLCKNRDDLFRLKYDKDFECDFDENAVWRMAEAAHQSVGGHAKPEMWEKPWRQEFLEGKTGDQDEKFLPIRGTLNPQVASALINELPPDSTALIDKYKFWAMFEKGGWNRREGYDACFRDDGFWDRLKTTEVCDRNWYEGGYDENDPRNFKEYRPVFADHIAVPALLGANDEDMLAYTCNKLREKRGEPMNKCEENFELIDAVYHADLTILRLDIRIGWNMCRNLEWVTCAIRGLIPEQQGRNKVRFATTTRLKIEDFLFRKSKCAQRCEETYSTHDIFLAEVAMISYMCHNRDDLFRLEIGQDFECIFDMKSISRLEAAASKSPGGFSVPEMWVKPWLKSPK